ncbi:MAG: hypothetical protein OEZ36_04235 [Spirochaetota bacterium]|nr:hypothetical protein [Spirochaetota bacterium]
MKRYSLVISVMALLSVTFMSEIKAAESKDVEGSWTALVRGRNNKSFSAHVGIKKVGKIYQVKGVSNDRRIIWYGEGNFSGGTFTYTYRVRFSPVKGKGTLKLSADGKTLSGQFEETGGRRVSKDPKPSTGTEDWARYEAKVETQKAEEDKSPKASSEKTEVKSAEKLSSGTATDK